MSEFLDRVFDPDFVEKSRYAELLVQEIPKKYRYDIMVEVFRRKERGIGHKIAIFANELFPKLTTDEKRKFVQVVSEELKNTRESAIVGKTIQILPSGVWSKVEETARLRIENKLITSIRDGKMQSYADQCDDGALGTWALEILDECTLLDDLKKALLNKLDSLDDLQINYVFRFFSPILYRLEGKYKQWFVQSINKGLKNGNYRFYEHITPVVENNKYDWVKNIHEEYKDFTPARDEFNDLPF